MSTKPASKRLRNLFGEIRSFLFTLLVITAGFAFLIALLNGGIAGVEMLLGNIARWLIGIIQNVADFVQSLADGTRA